MAGFEQGIMTKGMEQIFDDNKRTASLFSATRTESDITGTEQLDYPSTGTSIEIIFFETDMKYDWSETGLDIYGDAVFYDKASNNNLKKDDKIVVDEETYIIQQVHTWRTRGTAIYDVMSAVRVA